MSDGPPWQLSDCSVYRYFLCPECNFKSRSETPFLEHMNTYHEVLEIKQSEIKTESDDLALLKDTKVIDGRKLVELINGTSVQITKNSGKPNVIIPIKKKSVKKSGVTFDCRSCGFLFDTINELREHIGFEHSELVIPSEDHDTFENIDTFNGNDVLDDYQDDNHLSDEDYIPPGKKPSSSTVKLKFTPTNSSKKKTNFGFTCQICDRKFSSHEILKEHLRDKHDGTAPLNPNNPGYNRSDVQVKVRCSHCKQDFRSYHYLKSHCEREHKNLPIRFTKRTVKVLDELTSEEILIKEVAGDAATYKCDHCPYTTTHHDLRGLHMQKEHNDSTKVVWFKCDKCDFRCRQRRTIAKHKQDHKSGLFDQTKKKMVFKFVNKADDDQNKGLFNFTDTSTNPEPEDMKITPTRVVLQCQVCEGPPFREFNYYHALKAHFDGNHGVQKLLFRKRVIKGNDGLEDIFAKEDGDDRVYTCEYCDYVTHMADLFGIHTEKEHNDSSKLVFVKCDKCGYTSKTRGNLINHKRLVHENYKPKKCTQCDRRFSTKALLEEHLMRSHNPEGILCNDCGKIFSSPKLLKRHELWHHNPEQAGGPVPCHICGKISMHKYALQKHIARVHRKKEASDDGTPCHICGKTYAEKKSLKTHLAKVHAVFDH